MRYISDYTHLLKDAAVSWYQHQPFRSSAIIAYYAIFSLPGLLVIVTHMAGYVFGREQVIERITAQVRSMIGPDTAQSVEAMIANASSEEGSLVAGILGVATLVFGATGVFYQIQQILNRIWEVQPRKSRHFLPLLVMQRLFSFGLIMTVAFLLLVSLFISTMLSAFGEWFAERFSLVATVLLGIANFALSLGVVAVLFAALFRVVPDAKIEWRSVWTGAIFTAVLFKLAEFGLSLYFSHTDPGSTYGAAGSVILIMLWVSYSSMILLLGAEFTRRVSLHLQGPIEPSEHAEQADESGRMPDAGT